jgi:hypothetical protein
MSFLLLVLMVKVAYSKPTENANETWAIRHPIPAIPSHRYLQDGNMYGYILKKEQKVQKVLYNT